MGQNIANNTISNELSNYINTQNINISVDDAFSQTNNHGNDYLNDIDARSFYNRSDDSQRDVNDRESSNEVQKSKSKSNRSKNSKQTQSIVRKNTAEGKESPSPNIPIPQNRKYSVEYGKSFRNENSYIHDSKLFKGLFNKSGVSAKENPFPE